MQTQPITPVETTGGTLRGISVSVENDPVAKNVPRRHPFDCRPFLKSEVNEAKFWAKVDKNGPPPVCCPELSEACWTWTAAKNKRGYGSFSVNARLILAHRVSVILDGRKLPTGMVTDHLCHNPSCVNPRHLKVETILGNNRNNAKVQSNFCKRGHEFSGWNLFYKHGSRQCRQCQRIHFATWKSKKRSETPAKGVS